MLAALLADENSSTIALSSPLWEAAMAEGVAGWLAYRLQQKSGSMPALSSDVRESLRLQTAGALRLRHQAAEILTAARRHGVPLIILRGMAVAEHLYPRLSLRPFTDLDLLVTPENKGKAGELLASFGFTPTPLYPHVWENDGMLADLHHEPLGMERISAWAALTPLRADDFFAHAQEGSIAGVRADVLPSRLLLPYLSFHALKHSFDRLIWLCDIERLALQIEKDQDWDDVLRGIREYRLERPCFYALAYARAHLGAPVPGELLEAIQPRMGLVERRLFARYMQHEVIPYLAERLFARMQPDLGSRMVFWKETILPRPEVRRQVAGGGCVRCHFIRTRLLQLLRAGRLILAEWLALLLPPSR